MALAQNKRLQRGRFADAGLPVPPFAVVTSAAEIRAFGAEHGWPVVLKAARGGYDGRGVWIGADEKSAVALAAELLEQGVELLAEQWVPIEQELAILIARRPGGETAVYPLVETVQVDGMCREVIAPASVAPKLAAEAARIAEAVAEISGVVGILAVELFISGGRVLINEIATRPHNSGHYSIEGCTTSQFEQHLRAILDWPLGSTALTAPAVVTVNVVGGPDGSEPASRLREALAIEGAHVHLYGKGARPGRKLGHVTVRGEDLTEVRARANEAAAILSGSARVGAPI
jgi:5-(carboxyamino)imidazole ribonucleotide synthase